LSESEFAGYPIFGYENETGFYGGGLVYVRHRPKHFDTSIPQNSYYLSTEYSEKKQFTIKFEPKIHLKMVFIHSIQHLTLENGPQNFIGIGNKLPLRK